MKIKVKINHFKLDLDKLIYKSEHEYSSINEFVDKNKLKFRVLIHIFKKHIQKYFSKNSINHYTEQLILDTANAVIEKQLGKSPNISNVCFIQVIEKLCYILSKIKYNPNKLKDQILHIENKISNNCNFVGGNRNTYNINYTL